MGGPCAWALDTDAPEPQVTVMRREPAATGLASHTGTDPYGRAVGPAEDHTEPKLDSEGRTAAEAGTSAVKARKRKS